MKKLLLYIHELTRGALDLKSLNNIFPGWKKRYKDKMNKRNARARKASKEPNLEESADSEEDTGAEEDPEFLETEE